MSDAWGARSGHDDGDIDVFATGRTAALEPGDAPDDIDDLADHVRHGAAAVRAGLERAREFHARPGHRPGPAIDTTSSRQGRVTDIVRPVLVSPLVAVDAVVAGGVLSRPVPGLAVDTAAGGADGHRYLVWDAVLTSRRGAAIRCSLHLSASPSMVVTVLELIPRQRLPWSHQRFVRDGLTAIDVIAERLVEIGRRSESPGTGAAPGVQIADAGSGRLQCLR